MRATWFLIISWILVSFFVWTAPNTPELVQMLGYSTRNIIDGKLWTPITATFIHADTAHLLVNAVAFTFFGLAVEKEIGPGRMVGVFLIGAIVGGLVSSAFYGVNEISVGASGGVSAVLGAAIFLAPFRFSMFPYIFPAPIVLVGFLYIISNIIGLLTDTIGPISYAAHVGGLAFGVGYGFSKIGTKRGLFVILAGFILLLTFSYLLMILKT